MNPFEQKLVDMMKKKEYRAKTLEELKILLEIKNTKKERQLKEAITSLQEKGKLVILHQGKINSPENAGIMKGKVVRSSKEYVFVEVLGSKEEIFIPPGKTQNVFEGDMVLVSIEKLTNGNNKRIGKIVQVITRDRMHVVGTFVIENGKPTVVINTKGSIRKLAVVGVPNLVEGHEVLLSMDEKGNWNVEKLLGHKDEPTTEILSFLYNHGIKTEFNKETLEEADHVSETIDEMEFYTRRNLTEEMIITIDGADAKDLDDAIQLSVKDSGNYLLSVHIADVSYYVTQKSALDEEAFERGTSVYLSNKVIPMLPQKLSNGICSLHPDVDRLTITCQMEIDKFGKVVSHEIFDSVIKSKCRLTYDEVNEMIEEKSQTIEKYQDIYPTIINMQELSLLLRERRVQQGALDFDVKEAKIKVDEDNFPIDIIVRERKEAERLIEEFMLIANETVALHFDEMELPLIYRVHDVPVEAKVEVLSSLVAKLGYEELFVENYDNSKDIQKLLNGLKDTDMESTIHTLAIRMMSKAVYSDDNIGHFGLAKDYYAHFTSPIRRYPDLIVHRLIREFLFEHKLSKKSRDFWSREINKISVQSSNKEQKASAAERDFLERKKAEYMGQFVGDNFEGIVSSITDFGVYVELDNTVQGLIPYESFDEYIQFDKESYLARGESLELKIGDKVKVLLVSTDKESQKIDFQYIEKIK